MNIWWCGGEQGVVLLNIEDFIISHTVRECGDGNGARKILKMSYLIAACMCRQFDIK